MSAAAETSPKDNILLGKLSELTDAISVHLETTETQRDIRDKVRSMIAKLIMEIVEKDLKMSIQAIESGSEEQDG